MSRTSFLLSFALTTSLNPLGLGSLNQVISPFIRRVFSRTKRAYHNSHTSCNSISSKAFTYIIITESASVNGSSASGDNSTLSLLAAPTPASKRQQLRNSSLLSMHRFRPLIHGKQSCIPSSRNYRYHGNNDSSHDISLNLFSECEISSSTNIRRRTNGLFRHPQRPRAQFRRYELLM